jgi:hypothetical protein
MISLLEALGLGDASVELVVAAVFVTTFAIVGAVAYLLLFRGTTTDRETTAGTADRAGRLPGAGSTWSFEINGRLPMSRETSDRIVDAVGDAFRPPELSARQLQNVEPLAVIRGVAVKVYRGFFITVGLIGLIAAAFLFRAHTPANMIGLPAGIVLLLSLGALLNGLVPSRSVTGWTESLDFRPLLKKIHVDVHHAEPLRLSLTEAQSQRAIDLIRQGLPLSEAARTVYPDFDRLDAFARQAIESALQELAKTR